MVAATALVESEPAISCGVVVCEESVSVTAPVAGSAALTEVEPALSVGELAPLADTMPATGPARTMVGAPATVTTGATIGDWATTVSLAIVCGAATLPSALWRSWTAEAAISDWVGADCSELGALAGSTPWTACGATVAGAEGSLPGADPEVPVGAVNPVEAVDGGVALFVSAVDWEDVGATLSEPRLAGGGATDDDCAAEVPSVDGPAS